MHWPTLRLQLFGWLGPPNPGAPPLRWSPGAVRWARAHRLGGLLWAWSEEGLADLGPAGRPAAQDWARNFAGHACRAELFAHRWPNWAQSPLIFKGADVAEALYKDPGARAAADLDLLVPAATLPATARALGGELVMPRYERWLHEPLYAVGVRLDGLLIELHAAAQPPHRGPLPAETLLARASPGHLGGRPVWLPCPVDRAILWLANVAKDGLHGPLSQWIDGLLALRALDRAASEVLWARAGAARLAPCLRLCQLRLARLGLAPLLPEWFRAPPGWRTRLALTLPPDPRRLDPERRWRYQASRLVTADAAAAVATVARWPARLWAERPRGGQPTQAP